MQKVSHHVSACEEKKTTFTISVNGLDTILAPVIIHSSADFNRCVYVFEALCGQCGCGNWFLKCALVYSLLAAYATAANVLHRKVATL